MLKIIVTIGAIQSVAIVVNLIRSKIIAVHLGPEGVGIISVVDQCVQLVAYFSAFSLPFASVKFLSRSHSESPEAFRKTYLSFLKASLVLVLIGTGVAILLLVVRADVFGPELSRYQGFLLIAVVGMPAMILSGFFNHVLAAAQKFKAASTLTLITAIALTVASAIGIALGHISGFYIGNVLAASSVVIGSLIYLRQSLKLPIYDREARVAREWRRSPEIVPFSLMLFIAAWTHSLSLLLARYSVLTYFGEAEAGILQAAIAISMAINLVLNPANGLFLTPLMNRKIEKEEKIVQAQEFEKKLLIVLGCFAMPIVLFPDGILAVLFSTEFMAAARYLYLFVLAQCISQIAGVYQALLIGVDDWRSYATITCSGHLILGVSSWLLAPSYGLLGVGAGFLISSLSLSAMTWARLKWTHGFELRDNLGLLSLYTVGSPALAGWYFHATGTWDLTLAFGKVGVYVAFVGILWIFLSKEERISLYGLWNRITVQEL
jgi:O-antigen/teichoic acid export membrane protein